MTKCQESTVTSDSSWGKSTSCTPPAHPLHSHHASEPLTPWEILCECWRWMEACTYSQTSRKNTHKDQTNNLFKYTFARDAYRQTFRVGLHIFQQFQRNKQPERIIFTDEDVIVFTEIFCIRYENVQLCCEMLIKLWNAQHLHELLIS